MVVVSGSSASGGGTCASSNRDPPGATTCISFRVDGLFAPFGWWRAAAATSTLPLRSGHGEGVIILRAVSGER
jgi:hypothetical protein